MAADSGFITDGHLVDAISQVDEPSTNSDTPADRLSSTSISVHSRFTFTSQLVYLQ